MIYDEMFWILQPGKLTEAFKYFLQGMGYSKSNLFHIILIINVFIYSVNNVSG